MVNEAQTNLSVCGSEQHTFSSGPFLVNKCLLQNIGMTDTSNSTLYNHIKYRYD